MRVAFAMINCNRRDGSARAVNEVAERLAQRGHDVHLYARKAEDLDLGQITWHKVPGPGWPEIADFWSYYQSVNRQLKNNSYDIVHSIGCNTIRANVITIQNIQPCKTRIVAQLGQKESISLPRKITRHLYITATSAAEKAIYSAAPHKRPPMFLPVSRGVERELREFYDIGNAPVRIIPNAADTKIFHPIAPEERLRWRSENGLTENDIVCIFSGGEWARKGLDLAIQAMGLIMPPRAKLFVAGDDADRARFKMMAQTSGCADRVIFGGFRKDMATAMAASDLFLFPSHYEAFSLATIEAAACGLPIVAAKINGTEDFIQPGSTGGFVEHDPADIAKVLEPLLADDDLRRRMGENARLLVEKNYTWDRVTDMTEEAYRSYLENKK